MRLLKRLVAVSKEHGVGIPFVLDLPEPVIVGPVKRLLLLTTPRIASTTARSDGS